ncbi:hypothetical protein ADICEAN_01596 [Cesiribacter andamanensis AMV16]|uniref:Uncharacterized protein n=1 Tax=Cesiribacter andamanensis AMV16 TaxID=1279009 RepID=M7N7R4_9BACT|nr:hypothetical protein ADICEAN_01596 [Cesiribacter andamanensis AMV16]
MKTVANIQDLTFFSSINRGNGAPDLDALVVLLQVIVRNPALLRFALAADFEFGQVGVSYIKLLFFVLS